MPRVEKFSYTRLLVQKDGHNITRKCKVQNPNHWACIYLLAGCGRLHCQVTFALSSSITRQQRGSGWSRCHRRFFFFLFPPKPWHYGRGALWSLLAKVCLPLCRRVELDRCFSRYLRVLSRIISLSGMFGNARPPSSA